MACGCENNECIQVFLDPCAASVTLGVTAGHTGNYNMMVEFNGANLRRVVAVTNGQPITVPNIFNLDYTHTILFYTPSGAVLNDTCYKLRTMPTIFPNAPAPSYDWITTEEDYTVTVNSRRLLVDTGDGAVTVTIPDGLPGEYVIRRASGAGNNVIISGKVNGPSGEVLTPVSESLTLSWDSDNGQYNTI